MSVVRVTSSWGTDPTLYRATPGRRGSWGERYFTDDPVEECDYLLVLNRPERRLRVRCARDRVWAVIMEPPDEHYKAGTGATAATPACTRVTRPRAVHASFLRTRADLVGRT
jgi:hypothetical protein